MFIPEHLSKRIMLRISNTMYDPLGLISPFLIKFKVEMRSLYSEDYKVLKWDDKVPSSLHQRWIDLSQQLFEVNDIEFERCIKPENASKEKPTLITLSDGSVLAFCAVSYIRWLMTNGTYHVRLIMAKTRVAPLKKLSIPRLELQGAVANARLTQTITEHSGLEFGASFNFVDSGAVLGMIENGASSLKEFCGTRVGEILSKTDQRNWGWIKGSENISDIGTRGALPSELGLHSEWQNGPKWMYQPQSEWPVDMGFKEKVPEEEVAKYRVMAAVVQKAKVSVIPIRKYSTLSKLLKVTMIVFRFIHNLKFRKDKSMKRVDTVDEKGRIPLFSGHEMKKAESYWEDQAMLLSLKDFKDGKFQSLRAHVVKSEDWSYHKVDKVVISGRTRDGLKIGYDVSELPVLLVRHRYTKLFLKQLHEEDCGGASKVANKSRYKYWIPQAIKTLKSIRKNRFKCKLIEKELQGQIMAPLPTYRTMISNPWRTVSLDLFGPITIRDSVKKRVTSKCWGVIYNCAVTRAIHLDVTEDYSCDSLLQSSKRFTSLRGVVSKFISDQGSQLTASASGLTKKEFEDESEAISHVQKDKNWSKVKQWVGKQKAEWEFVPAKGQHMNGLSESLIRWYKKILKPMLNSQRFTISEVQTALYQVADIMNSRPLSRRPGVDPLDGGPVTPNHLLLGRATGESPIGDFDVKLNITKRTQMIDQVVSDWWRKWYCSVFQDLVPSYKWNQKTREVQVGDVVLMFNENEIKGKYSLGRVKEVIPSRTDNIVRKAIIEYKNVKANSDLTKLKMKETERAIHNLVVIVPNDYTDEDDLEENSDNENTD